MTETGGSPPEPPGRRALLDGLDAVNWHALQHAYGPADDVPDLLRLLLSDDPEARERAWGGLYGSVVHQGTLYEASAPVVPFVLRLLADALGVWSGEEQAGAALEYLRFLAALGEGTSFLAAHTLAHGEADRGFWQAGLTAAGRGELEAEAEVERGWVRAVQAELGKGLPLYWHCLDARDRELASLAVYLLAHLPAHAAESLPRLRATFDQTHHPGLRRDIAHALRVLAWPEADLREMFAGWLAADPDPALRLIAAAALVAWDGERAAQAPVERLQQAVRELAPAGWWEAGYPLPDGDGPLADWEADGLRLAVHALTWLGPGRGLDELLRAWPAIGEPGTAGEVAGRMLDLAFREGGGLEAPASRHALQLGPAATGVGYWPPEPQPARPASSLTARQRQVLAALAAHDAFWAQPQHLLKLYGLPETRDALRLYLSG